MFVTHSFLGIKKGQLNYLFFYLTEDYVQQQKALKEQLDPLLEEFGRNLLDKGAIVKAFSNDVEKTNKEVQNKWEQIDLRDVVFFNDNNQMPGLLLIDEDFDEFNPKSDQWLYISLRDYMNEFGQIKIFELQSLLKTLSEICNSDQNLFEEAKSYIRKNEGHEAHKILELKPGIFGMSIDLKEAYNFIRHWKNKYKE